MHRGQPMNNYLYFYNLTSSKKNKKENRIGTEGTVMKMKWESVTINEND